MATVYTSEYQNAYVSEPSVKNDVTKLHGRVRVVKADHTIDTKLTAADVIKICKLPAGARVLDARIVAPIDNGGTPAGIYKVGWEANGSDAADDDGFFAVAECDFGAAALDAKMLGTAPAFGKKFAAETIVSATVTETSGDSDGLVHEFLILYVLD